MTTLMQSLGASPLIELKRWLDEAERSGACEPTAATLATATPEGRPSARLMLCKEVTATGVRFFTNYNSRKAAELERNPCAAVAFHWPSLQRQVRLEGRLVKTSRAVSEAYFATRPRGSQIGAWASPQSREVSDFSTLAGLVAAVEERFPEGVPVPCPPHWGGFELTVTSAEFWQGHGSRLHDRVCFEQIGAAWRKLQLAP